MKELIIKDLEAEVEGNKILKGVNLTINGGDTLALLGPNGHGKSTLLNVLMGHPHYKVTNGTSEKEEREALLASNGFKTMEQLRNSYVLEQKQKANENAFYDDDTYLGEKDANGDRKYDGLIHKFIEEYHPYHVRHILVKVDASSDQIVDGKISEDDAKQLANVYSRLTSGEETFGEVAAVVGWTNQTKMLLIAS